MENEVDRNSSAKTTAYLKLEAHRDKEQNNRPRIDGPGFCATAYLYTNKSGQPCAVLYKGRQRKPLRCFRYQGEDDRDQGIRSFFDECEPQKRSERLLAVGDVLVSTWGYDQTNVDFYEVVKLSGDWSVVIKEIASNRKFTDYDQGKATPLPGDYIGGESRHQVCSHNGKSISLSSFQSGRLLEPKGELNGKAIYPAVNFSSGR